MAARSPDGRRLLLLVFFSGGIICLIWACSKLAGDDSESKQIEIRQQEERELVLSSIVPTKRGEDVGLDLLSANMPGESADVDHVCRRTSTEHFVMVRADIVPNGEAQRITMHFCVDVESKIVRPADSEARALTEIR
jgi:hypothetical protein